MVPIRNSPRIARIYEGCINEYYIICEQEVLCTTSSFCDALFLLFASYYTFNLEYPKQVQNILFFLQDHVLSFPDNLSRPINYVTVVTDVKKHLS